MKNPQNQYILEIDKLNCSLGERQILHDINLAVRKGEFVGLIGPNGAGKTTLLKCINKINPARGTIKVNGRDVSEIDEKKIAREAALMHQNTSITFAFPAIDVVMMGRYPYLGRLKNEGRQDFETARKHMEYTDTLKLEKKNINTISGGERQRVLFAKALTQETGLLLLDEPTASLDITHQEQIFKLSRELCESGKTVMAAVHDLKIAARYCTRLVLMKDGRVLSDGEPEKVLTSENISKAYGMNALVFRNRITGQLDFYIHQCQDAKKSSIHVIGGGGSAAGVLRQLYENGFKITAGVFAQGDSDLQCAQVFNIPHLVSKPFSEICESLFLENTEMVKKAHITILCNMPFGVMNLKNLEAAGNARKLIIIEDDSPEARDFTGGEALAMYRELRRRAVVTTSARLHEVVE